MQLPLVKALALAGIIHSSIAAPTSNGDSKLEVVKTTTTSDGQVIDWVKKESQGNIASAPPLPAKRGEIPAIESLIGNDEGRKGPAGTVPIVRNNGIKFPVKRLPEASDHGSNESSDTVAPAAAANYQGKHWYSSTAQNVDNHGGTGRFSLYDAYVQSGGDFSLLQTAVIRNNVPVEDRQTVEAGWINYPNQVQAPHLFSYFTTDGYKSNADNLGGWNRDVAGWVQTDDSIYPGIPFSPLSQRGGDQLESEIMYQLFEGNWWLYVLGRYIGYYPAHLFTKNGNSASQTLESHSNAINFYGEIYNSETSMTTTDMGSGAWANAGYGQAAYIRTINYINTNGNLVAYDGSRGVVVSDTNRYTLEQHYNSGNDWGSYIFLGGPGAGGVIDG